MHVRSLCRFGIIACLTAIVAASSHNVAHMADDGRIRPYEGNTYFWQYKGEPVLLLGGSDQDNPFNHPNLSGHGLEAHLDLLASVGGNYIRNTMTSRDRQADDWEFFNDDNVYPFYQDEETGLYDLERFNDAYWERFRRFLDMTAERDIIVQIEVWDRVDYARDHTAYPGKGWSEQPYNPANNINYTAEESGLPEVVNTHPAQRENPFFSSVSELENNEILLPFQQAFVDKMLSYTLPHGHILYCISNETNEEAEWGAYWARYLQDAAEAVGVNAHVTEMWDPSDLSHPMHRRTFDHPELYSYVDISQNNHQVGQSHWDNAQEQRRRIADFPRPINNVKMYGGVTHGGGYEEGLRRLWRNALGGMASARFHRPSAWTDQGPLHGAGLSTEAQAYIRSARVLMDALGWPEIEPDIGFVDLVMNETGKVQTEKTHVAYTRSTDGTARFYVNGKKTTEAVIDGDLSNWDASMRLGLASELPEGRGWRGAYHGVALYNRALDASEIADHYALGTVQHRQGLLAQYTFAEGDGNAVLDVSGQGPDLSLRIETPDAVAWTDDGLAVHGDAGIATEAPTEQLTAAIQESHALTLEAWITPATLDQSGPARIVTLSQGTSHRNFTVGQSDAFYEMRLRTTATSSNGLPELGSGGASADASIGAARSPNYDRAAIFVCHGGLLQVDMDLFQPGLATKWFDPRTAEWTDAVPEEAGYFQPPTTEDWLLVIR